MVCAMARSPGTDPVFADPVGVDRVFADRVLIEPPRKCRMFTPASKPAWLTRTNSAAGPWNQVAVIQPSSCHTDANDAQSAESRAIAQVSMSLRILNSSASRLGQHVRPFCAEFLSVLTI